MKPWTDSNKRQGRDGDVFLEERDVPSGGGIVLAVALVLASWACAVLLSVMVAP